MIVYRTKPKQKRAPKPVPEFPRGRVVQVTPRGAAGPRCYDDPSPITALVVAARSELEQFARVWEASVR
jgi:hypothetical protein